MSGIQGGLYFLTFLVSIMLVIRWCMTYDDTPLDKTGGGLFAMRDPNWRRNSKQQMLRNSRQWQESSRHPNQEIN
jgi:hypothetical protein